MHRRRELTLERQHHAKEYGKALRELFATRMKADFPQWRPVPAPKHWYWPGERVFVRERPDAWFVVVLSPDPKDHDAFYVEVGWSLRKRVPELSMRPCPDEPEKEAVLNREYLCMLGELVPGRRTSQNDMDGWAIDWRTFSTDYDEILAALVERQARLGTEQARAVVSPLVDDAIAALAQYGVPYLERQLPLLLAWRSNTLGNSDAQKPRAGWLER